MRSRAGLLQRRRAFDRTVAEDGFEAEPVGAQDGDDELHRDARGVPRRSLDAERGLAGGRVELLGLERVEHRRGDSLVSPCQLQPVLVHQHLVERAVGEILAEDRLATVRVEPRRLEAERMSIDEPHPADPDRRRPRSKTERLAYPARRRGTVEAEDAGPRRLTLLGELGADAAQPTDLADEAGRGDEGPGALAADEESLALETVQRLAKGHPADAEPLGQLPLGWEPEPAGELARLDPLGEPLLDLVVSGD